MNRDPLSTSYARALLELADERHELEAVSDEVSFLLELIRSDRDLRTFILSPGIDAGEKKKVIETAFRGKLTDTLVDFLEVVVVEKSRAPLLEGILDAYGGLLDEKMGRVHVEAVTAVPMSNDRQERLTSTLSAKLKKTVILDTSIRPEILGGLVIRYDDWVVDASIRSRLKTLSARVGEHKLGSDLIHEN